MPGILVPVIVGVFSGIVGSVVTQIVSYMRETRSFRLSKKSECYNFFVFTVSGVLFGSEGETYDFQRMVNEAVAKVALYASTDVVSALHELDGIEDIQSEQAYSAFLKVIGRMREDVGSADQAAVENILKLRRLGRRKTDLFSVLPLDQAASLDAYIAARPDPKPSRPEAVRLLLADSLTGLGYLPGRDDPGMAG